MTPLSSSPAQSEFEQLSNFRDVAKSVDGFANTTRLRPGLLFRSARLESASSSDKHKLVNEYGIRTILDLRSTTEHIEAAKKYGHVADLVSTVDPDGLWKMQPTSPDRSSFKQVAINLNGKGFERSLVWRLSYWNIVKLASLMAVGYRLEAIRILGKEVLQPRGLVGLGYDTLDHSQPELKQIFDVLAAHERWPVLIHCTQGKDRTGLVVIMLLLLCGVATDAVSHDYLLSEVALEPEREERLREISSIGLDESFATCPPNFTAKMVDYLGNQYGGIVKYLCHIGVDEAAQRSICAKLLAKPLAEP